MQGKGGIEGDHSGSLRGIVKDHPKQYGSYVDEAGEWVEREDVWIHYDLHPFRKLRYGPLKPGYGSHGGHVGPEFGFGHAMGDAKKYRISTRSESALPSSRWSAVAPNETKQ